MSLPSVAYHRGTLTWACYRSDRVLQRIVRIKTCSDAMVRKKALGKGRTYKRLISNSKMYCLP